VSTGTLRGLCALRVFGLGRPRLARCPPAWDETTAGAISPFSSEETRALPSGAAVYLPVLEMIASRKVGIAIGALVLFAVAGGAFAIYSVGADFQKSMEVQDAAHKAVRPLLEAVTTKKLKVGDSLQQVEDVLKYADLSFSVERQVFPHTTLFSGLSTGAGSGFTIRIEFDANDRVTRIELHESFLGL
jgi:hypothetical protein